MPMLCPKCTGSFENNLQCPKCGLLLVYQSRNAVDESMTLVDRPSWHQSPAGRMFAGVLIALGLSFGLLKLAGSFLPAANSSVITPEAELGLFYGLQAIAVTIGGMLSGVGRRRGYTYGFGVGLASGGIALIGIASGVLASIVAPFASKLLEVDAAVHPAEMDMAHFTLYGVPLLHALAGAVGGFIGSSVWKPPPELEMPTVVKKVEKNPEEETGLITKIKLPSNEDGEKGVLSGGIAWIRVALGMGIAVFGGSFGTEPVRKFIITASEGGMQIRDQIQDQVTLGEIFALSIFIGGIIGGSGQSNGLKQGIVVGVGAGLGMLPFLMSGDLAEYTVYVVLSAVFIAPLGGWFGANLLPPPPPPKLTLGATD